MARDYDGSSGYLSISNGDPFRVGNWTIAVWLNIDAATGNATFVTHQLPGNGLLPMVLALGNGGSEGGVGVLYGGTYNGIGPNNWHIARWAVPPLGRWFHACATMDVANIVRLYINGSLVGQDTAGTGAAGIGTAGVSMWFGRNWGGARYLDGRMSRLGIWDRALPPTSILRLAQGERPTRILPESLIGSWRMDGETGREQDVGQYRRIATPLGATGPRGEPPYEMVDPSVPRAQQLGAPAFIGAAMAARIGGN